MNRRAFIKRHFGRAALTLLLLCLIVYTVFHAIGNSAGSLVTTPAESITDTRLLGGTGWLFRDETVLTSPFPGLVYSTAESGEKVGKNVSVATVYTGNTTSLEARQDALDLLCETVSVLEQSLPSVGTSVSNADKYRKEAEQILMKLRLAQRSGDYATLGEREKEMLILLNRYGALTGERDELESALAQARAERDAMLVGESHSIVNQVASAYYYDRSCVDGLEGYFNGQALAALTPESLQTLKKQSPDYTRQEQIAGKLCYGQSWHLAVETVETAGQLFETGKSYTVSFPQNRDLELQLVCERVMRGNGISVVIFRSDVTPSDFDFLRSQTVEITVGSVGGFYIPAHAVVNLGGEIGVYIFEESTVRFCRISVIYEGDGYLIASEEDPITGHPIRYLGRNDLIITSGKKLYDGKVYQ
jgi:hypothetical protein